MNQDKASKILADIFAPPPAGEAGLHVSNDDLSGWAEDTLTGGDFDRVQAHLDRCPECAEIATRLTLAMARCDEPLPFPIFTPDFKEMRERPKLDDQLALAASSVDLPEIVPINNLLPGFNGLASGDGCAPSCASTLRLEGGDANSPAPPAVLAVWPSGQTEPVSFKLCTGHWHADIRLPLPWPETVALLKSGKVRLVPVP
jgi:hypothetical protein